MPGALNTAGVKLGAMCIAAAAAAGAATWTSAAQPSSTSAPRASHVSAKTDARSGDSDGKNPIVCVGADAVFRVPKRGGDCATGDQRLVLAPPDHKAKDLGCIGCDPWGPKAARQDERLTDIERRIDALEHASRFEVIDRRGRVIFSVAPGRVLLFNSDEQPVVGILAMQRGGVIKGQSADAARVVSIGAGGASGGLRIEEAGNVRVDLGRQPAGNYALRLPHGKGQLAGIGESRAGSGVLLIGDAEGRLRASMQTVDGKGAIGVFDAGGAAVLSMTEGKTGGLLAIGDKTGEGMVKMGVNNGRYGVVLAGPRAGFPLVPTSGLPGSYFLGCAGGDGCRP